MYKKQKYKGLIIYYNKNGSPFDTPYISIVNPHITYPDGSAGKYRRNIRNKACRLLGMYIKSS